MRLFPTFLSTAAALVLATSANASTVLYEDFDAENGGASFLNYASFSQFSVGTAFVDDAPGGTVDLVKTGDFGITCAGGSGSCVDLDGSTRNAGYLVTAASYAFNMGDIVTLSFLASGNQRGGNADDIRFGFIFGGSTNFDNVILSGFLNGTFGPYSTDAISAAPLAVASNTPFTNNSFSFRALQSGSFNAFLGTQGGDNVGPLIDNVRLDITAGVPEPTTWAMMVLGFGVIGSAMRRRDRRLSFA